MARLIGPADDPQGARRPAVPSTRSTTVSRAEAGSGGGAMS